MTTTKRSFYGLLLTAIIFIASTFLGRLVPPTGFVFRAFWSYLFMAILTLMTISISKENVKFHIATPHLKDIVKLTFIGLVISIVTNLLTANIGPLFIVNTLIFTFFLGLTAGYYQEKCSNTMTSVLVHRCGSIPAIFAAFAMGMG